ncbi:hypothetical protein LCGC14_2553430 [marine sediment metagenome]|uniref:Uncharacterized protein n=1 Tax=marine sediment metagenome TaxID=412755 RepID=A0A0F9CYF7_9ZZZZ
MATRIGIPGRDVELYVRFIDINGNLINADNTPLVTIYDSVGTIRQASTNIGVSLADDPGLYLLDYSIPLTGPDGYWQDVWTAKIGDETISSTFRFLVSSTGEIEQDVEPTFETGVIIPWDFTKEEVYGINILLRIVRARLKGDGVRKIRDGQEYTEEDCSVFTTSELICFLYNSLSTFNQYPHFTQFTFADSQLYTLFVDVISQGAVLLALAAQTLIERGREFSINDNGVTYQPPQVSEILNSQYNAQLADYKEKLKMIKLSLKPAPQSLGTFRITAISPSYLRLRHLRERQIV